MADIKKIAEELVNLTVKEVNDLAGVLKEDYGIEPAASAPVVVAGGASDEGEAAVEKTEFNVVLNGHGPNKLKVLKAMKDALGLGLKDAKELVDNLPSTIKENAPKEEAETLKKQLEELGAEIELK